MSSHFPPNPYRPGSGEEPPYFAGRQEAFIKLRQARDAIAEGGGSSPMVVSGLRGIGKTVLLAQMRAKLEQDGWLVSPVVAFGSKRRLQTVWKLLHKGLREHDNKVPRLTGRRWNLGPLDLSAKAGASTSPTSPIALAPEVGLGLSGRLERNTPAYDHERLLREIQELAKWGERRHKGQSRPGIALLLDECQDAVLPDLATLADAGQEAAVGKWPLLIVLAGLPTTHDRLVKVRSFATRFPPIPIGKLSATEAIDALRIPATQRRVDFEAAALDAALEFAQGVPYHLQVIGQQAWEHQDLGKRTITLASVQAGYPLAREAIEVGMYQPLWRKASEEERRYLRSMLLAGRDHEGFLVAGLLAHLGKSHTESASIRRRLIDKGIIHQTTHGHLEYSYPGFDTYLQTKEDIALPGKLSLTTTPDL